MFPPTRAHHDPDGPIRLTDSDAAIARLSAVRLNYLSDPYIKNLVPRANFQPTRPPLINVGTYVRTVAIDDLVYQWINLSKEQGKKCQIVSMGAGSDTRFWRLATSAYKEHISGYVEVDFPEITVKKAMAIKKSKEMCMVLGDAADIKIVGGTSLHSPVYHLLSADLRQPPSEALASLVSSSAGSPALLDPSLPTLLIFECVLVYMQPEESNRLLRWFYEHIPSAGTGGVLGTIIYEMFGLGDAFGRVMVSNLKSRNVSLPGADPYPTTESLPARFLNLNFTAAHALTLREIRRAYIDPNELDRISRLEMLDEIEELDLVLEHYAITWGLALPQSDEHLKALWSQWGLKRKEREVNDDSF